MFPGFGAELGEVLEAGVEVPGVGLEAGFGGGLGEALVPGADVLADVAACDPALEVAGDRRWNFLGLAFDRVVSDAAVGIDGEGFGDRSGGAGFDAAGAGAAVAAVGLVWCEGQVGDQFSQEDPGAIVAGDQVAVFGDPAQSGSLGPEFVLDGAGVGIEAAG